MSNRCADQRQPVGCGGDAIPTLDARNGCGAQVIIEGFKSYKDQTISDPFSDKINVIGAAEYPACLPPLLFHETNQSWVLTSGRVGACSRC